MTTLPALISVLPRSALSGSTLLRTVLTTLACTALLGASPVAQAREWGWGKTLRGSGVVKTETRNVTGFTSISLSLPADTQIVQGDSEGISIESDDNILPLIETVVESGSLKIRLQDRNSSVSTKNLRIVVSAKTLEALSISGSGDLRAAKLKSPKLKASISGSGDINIASLDAETLAVSISGSGNFAAGGKLQSVESKIAGSGDIKIGKLEAQAVKVSIAGSGDATVWAKDTLTISVAGSGDVKYYGDAKVTQSIAGSGSVKRLGAAP